MNKKIQPIHIIVNGKRYTRDPAIDDMLHDPDHYSLQIGKTKIQCPKLHFYEADEPNAIYNIAGEGRCLHCHKRINIKDSHDFDKCKNNAS